MFRLRFALILTHPMFFSSNLYVSRLGNRPRLKDDQSWKTLQGHAVYQRKLVYTAVDLLKPGGESCC